MSQSRRSQTIESKAFGLRARHARQSFVERGYPKPSQGWLAERASSFLENDEISQTTVGMWLRGKTLPETPLRAWAFALALRVDPGWLVFGEESGAPSPEGAASLGASDELGPEEMLEPSSTEVSRTARRRKRG